MPRKQRTISKHLQKQDRMVPVGIQNKTPDDSPVEENALELPDREFKSLILRILQELRQKADKHEEKIDKFMENTDKKLEEFRKIMQEQNAKINSQLEIIQKQQLEIQKINDKISEMDDVTEGLRSRFETVEDRISGIEDKHLDTTLFQENSEKRTKKNEETLRVMCDTIKSKNLQVIGVPEQGEKTENTERIIEELLTENFPNIMKDENLAIQEAQRTPYR
ncbi:hypothetical protein NG726_28210, partial [Pseudomonas sp. MOB-449]|nr:hypothetical protein [Pseudomonas sp. MOB-449]